jgi:chromosomal replication initiation ATPase DnaA
LELSAKLAGVSVSDMTGRCRHFAATEARRIYVGAARALTMCSLPEIAGTIGRATHMSAFHQMQSFNKWPKVKQDAIVEAIRKELECPTK